MESTGVDHAATRTLEGARAHARGQAGAAAVTQMTIPASSATALPPGVEPSAVGWDETLGPGGYAARRLTRGTVLRITDLTGDTCVNVQLFNAHQPSERLNPADTVKVQWQAYLGEGTVLLSDLGRVLATVVADTSSGHDALCGHTNRRANEQRYGAGAVHSPTPNARDLLALAGARHGLEHRDLTAGVNLFAGVRVGPDGSLTLQPPAAVASHVELRAELDVIVLAAVAPHPLDDRPAYTAGPVRVTAWSAERPDPDPFRATTPERERAFLNTDDALAGGAR